MLVIFCLDVLACQEVALSEAVKAVNKDPAAKFKAPTKEDPGTCIVDWDTAKVVDGSIVVDPELVAAKEARMASAAKSESDAIEARISARRALRSLDLSGVPASSRAILRTIIDAIKEPQ